MRLGVKMMEQDVVAYDGTIRVADNVIVQFAYNYNTGRENQWIHPTGHNVFMDIQHQLRGSDHLDKQSRCNVLHGDQQCGNACD